MRKKGLIRHPRKICAHRPSKRFRRRLAWKLRMWKGFHHIGEWNRLMVTDLDQLRTDLRCGITILTIPIVPGYGRCRLLIGLEILQ